MVLKMARNLVPLTQLLKDHRWRSRLDYVAPAKRAGILTKHNELISLFEAPKSETMGHCIGPSPVWRER
jgi:hypothetical protein